MTNTKNYVPQEIDEGSDLIARYRTNLRYAGKQRQAHTDDQNRLNDEFKQDALLTVGLANHPKRDPIFAKAYERGHAYGYWEVLSELRSLAELFLNDTPPVKTVIVRVYNCRSSETLKTVVIPESEYAAFLSHMDTHANPYTVCEVITPVAFACAADAINDLLFR